MKEISVAELLEWRKAHRPHLLLDVRFEEEKLIADIGGLLIPLPELERRYREIPDDTLIVAYCHHGMRSLRATSFLQAKGYEVVNLRGGIDAWSREIDPTVPLY